MLLYVCPQSFSSGVVPYLGTYLTVLTMLDTALADTVEVSTPHAHKPPLFYLLEISRSTCPHV